MIDVRALLAALTGHDVKFILVGGAAATVHGAARLTQDIDIVYARDAGMITALGDVDLLGEIVGGGGYEALVAHTIELRVFGMRCLCLGLDKLIDVKRAAGRPKDLEVIAELEAIRDAAKGEPED